MRHFILMLMLVIAQLSQLFRSPTGIRNPNDEGMPNHLQSFQVGRVTPVRAIVAAGPDASGSPNALRAIRALVGGCATRSAYFDWGEHAPRVPVIASSRSRAFGRQN